MSVFAFTPVRFTVLLLASVGVALSMPDSLPVLQPTSPIEPSTPFRVSEAVGQDNGSLTSNLYLPVDYPPMPQTRGTDRHGVVRMPQGPPSMLRHTDRRLSGSRD